MVLLNRTMAHKIESDHSRIRALSNPRSRDHSVLPLRHLGDMYITYREKKTNIVIINCLLAYHNVHSQITTLTQGHVMVT